jgi:hypothetical protein
MATAYTADNYGDVPVFIPGLIGCFIRPFQFNIGTNTANAGFVVNDTVTLCDIPHKSGAGGALVVGYQVEIPSLDTGTSVRLSLGDNNGAAGAFQATFASLLQVGANGAGVLNPVMSWDGTTARAPVRGVVPKQYTSATASNGVVSFILKIATAPNTATTTGVIQGYLLLQPLGTNSVTF